MAIFVRGLVVAEVAIGHKAQAPREGVLSRLQWSCGLGGADPREKRLCRVDIGLLVEGRQRRVRAAADLDRHLPAAIRRLLELPSQLESEADGGVSVLNADDDRDAMRRLGVAASLVREDEVRLNRVPERRRRRSRSGADELRYQQQLRKNPGPKGENRRHD